MGAFGSFRTTGALALASWFLLVGCVTVSGGEPDLSTKVYIFEPEAPPDGSAASRGTPLTNAVLMIAPPTARAGYDTRQMIYTDSPARLNQYAFSQWADVPPRMLEPLLMRAMEASGSFGSVVDISSGVLADLRLDTELVTLRQEFSSAEPSDGRTSQVRIVLRSRVVDMRRRSVVATRRFEVTERTTTNDAPGNVAATNAALTDLLGQVTDFGRDVASSYDAGAQR